MSDIFWLSLDIERMREKHPASSLNAMNVNVVIGILGLSTLGENLLVVTNWTNLDPDDALLLHFSDSWFLICGFWSLAIILFVGLYLAFIVCKCVGPHLLWTFCLCIIFLIRDYLSVLLVYFRYVTIIAFLILRCWCIETCGGFLGPNFD